MQILVVGAGPAGLTAARNLVDVGHGVAVLESANAVGGSPAARSPVWS
jgi:flavin-dependent dehydrogenase